MDDAGADEETKIVVSSTSHLFAFQLVVKKGSRLQRGGGPGPRIFELVHNTLA